MSKWQEGAAFNALLYAKEKNKNYINFYKDDYIQ